MDKVPPELWKYLLDDATRFAVAFFARRPILGISVDDIAQEAAIVAWKKAKDDPALVLRLSQPDGEARRSHVWLVVRNTYRNKFRTSKRTVQAVSDEHPAFATATDGVDDGVDPRFDINDLLSKYSHGTDIGYAIRHVLEIEEEVDEAITPGVKRKTAQKRSQRRVGIGLSQLKSVLQQYLNEN